MGEFITILSVGKPYNFKPEGQANSVEGCTVMYIPTNSLNTTENADSGLLGYQPLKETFPIDFYDTAKANGIPSVAKVEYGMKLSGGKQVLYIKGLDFVKASK